MFPRIYASGFGPTLFVVQALKSPATTTTRIYHDNFRYMVGVGWVCNYFNISAKIIALITCRDQTIEFFLMEGVVAITRIYQ